MLVLTRKSLESIVIGSVGGPQRVLKMTVLDIHRKKVKLGFEAEAAVAIRRSEMLQQADEVATSDPSTELPPKI